MALVRSVALTLAAVLLPVTGVYASSGASSVPEAGNLMLFAAGVAGLIIGRRSSRSRRRDD
jgi:hypothetical protein